MRPSQLLASVSLLAATTSAWPFPWSPVDAAKRELAPLVRREPATTYDLSYSGVQGNTATTQASSTANSDASASATTTDGGSTQETGKSTAQTTGKTTDKATTGKSTETTGKLSGTTGSPESGDKSATTTSTKSIPLSDPPGGLAMLTPAAAYPTYFKIKDYVTFVWNYTSLVSSPTAVDVLASCSLNSATYTIATNQSFVPTQTIVWDTGEYQATAATTLLTGSYTLIIHDAAKEVTATPGPGVLGTYDQFYFGMYVPQAYTPFADWTCVTCSAGVSSMERHTVGFMVGMVVLTVFSFGWFTGAAGVW